MNERTTKIEPASLADIDTVSEQLGRPARGVIGIAARDSAGVPAVVATAPRLEDGTPFPTFYYLSHPEVVRLASNLEAAGKMNEYNLMLQEDGELLAAYKRAHDSFIADREEHEVVPELAGISAGGMPSRVKCLHALIGHSLAAGLGVNPIGDLAIKDAGIHFDKDGRFLV